MLKETGGMQKILSRRCGRCFKKKSIRLCYSTGVQYSVKDFVNLVLNELKLNIRGKVRIFTLGATIKKKNCIIECDKNILDL